MAAGKDGVEVARAYVTIIPRTDGTAGKVIYEEIAQSADKAGSEGGKKAGKGLAEGVKSVAIGNMVSSAVGGATQALSGFARDSMAAGKDFDAAMSQVAATMGKSKADVESEIVTVGDFTGNLRDFAKEMGSTTAFSATQSAEALNYMALAGYETEQSIQTLPTVLNLAAAGGMDLADASDMVTDAASALGLSVDDTAGLVDKMAQASSKSNTSVAQLGSAILTVGGTAKDLAGGTTELSTALGILANNGIKGAEGGTALRNIMLSLIPKSDEAAKTMEQLGFNAYDASGNLRPLNESFSDLAVGLSSLSTQDRQNALAGMFNKVDLKSVNAMLANTVEGVDAVEYAVMGLVSDLDGDEFESFWADMADQVDATGHKVEDVYQAIYDTLDDNGKVTDETRAALDEMGVSAGNVDLIMAGLSDTVLGGKSNWAELSEAIDDAGGAAEAMAKTQLDNLEGDLVTFSSALEGAQVSFFEAVDPLLRSFVRAGTEGLQSLTSVFKDSGAQDAIKGIANEVGNFAAGAIPALVEGGKGFADFFIRNKDGIGEFANVIGTVGKTAFDAVTGFADFILQHGTETASVLSAVAGGVAGFRVAQGVAGFITAFTTALGAASAASEGMAASQGVLNAVMSANPIVLVVTAIAALVAGLVTAYNTNEEFRSAVDGAFKSVQETVGTAIESVVGFLGGLGKKASEVADGMSGFASNVAGFFGGVADSASNAFGKVGEFVSSNLESAAKAGLNASSGLKKGLETAWKSISDSASTLFGKAKTSISSNLDNALKSGKGAAKGIQSTMSSAWGAAKDATSSAFESIRSTMSSKMSTAKSLIKASASYMSGILGFPNLPRAVEKVFESVKSSINSPVNSAIEFVKDAPGKIIGFFEGLGGDIADAIGDISFPTPHVSWETLSVFGMDTPISLPHVEWYDKGGIFPGGVPRIIGVAERRDEVVAPLEELPRLLGDSVSGESVTVNLNYTNDADAERMALDVARSLKRYKLAGVF